MHEEFSLAAPIDPASPVPQRVLITSTIFFLKVCNEAHTVLSFLPDAGLYDVKGQIHCGWRFCSFPALQICRVGTFAIVSSLLFNEHTTFKHFLPFPWNKCRQCPGVRENVCDDVMYTGYMIQLAFTAISGFVMT